MALKHLTRSAAVAWCPSAAFALSLRHESDGGSSTNAKSSTGGEEGNAGRQILALGTMGVDPLLEFAAVDVSSPSPSLPVVASVGAPAPFQCITWGASGDSSSSTGCLLAGGMADGDVTLWNVNEILK